MADIVVATVACENLHLTEVKVISPVLHPPGEVEGMLGSDADFCGECESTEMTIMGMMHREVPDDFPNLDVYRLRLSLI